MVVCYPCDAHVMAMWNPCYNHVTLFLFVLFSVSEIINHLSVPDSPCSFDSVNYGYKCPGNLTCRDMKDKNFPRSDVGYNGFHHFGNEHIGVTFDPYMLTCTLAPSTCYQNVNKQAINSTRRELHFHVQNNNKAVDLFKAMLMIRTRQRDARLAVCNNRWQEHLPSGPTPAGPTPAGPTSFI